MTHPINATPDYEARPWEERIHSVAESTAYVLRWLDPAMAEPGGTAAQHERSRPFKHLGSALAWARRRLFHDGVYGDVIELCFERRRVNPHTGRVFIDEIDVVDVSLAGFRNWTPNSNWSARGWTLSRPYRRCRLQED